MIVSHAPDVDAGLPWPELPPADELLVFVVELHANATRQ
jgi:hypothetical protein